MRAAQKDHRRDRDHGVDKEIRGHGTQRDETVRHDHAAQRLKIAVAHERAGDLIAAVHARERVRAHQVRRRKEMDDVAQHQNRKRVHKKGAAKAEHEPHAQNHARHGVCEHGKEIHEHAGPARQCRADACQRRCIAEHHPEERGKRRDFERV